ncbi:MAG: dTDP-4-dehydrorhamnose 3,5-epimerase [Candidatus Moranbacteria bacterium CG10_big_fil_rev_8_21_14_0_10_35_21]|nr:MAG: dTDP-4-dehydrorhamnose 3,5-epimerase [Candidatus Moranbacteria bacterium CG10_big_fil_rev_8_21_14_0_10_35_21]PJA88397.1 MAG: dTDP-4-dehydrorhamnose 3,5-epimerase [Candidatus Moranbacteria bacterium CG_4_9_14_3_um_filter_36_9]
MEGAVIKKLEKFSDQRGWLTELFRTDELDYQPVMSYVSVTKPGIIRGPHEHKEQSDCFVFLGPGNFELHLWDNQESSQTKGDYLKLEVGENNPTLVIVPPGVVHGYKCVSEIDGWCINLPDKLYRGENKKEEVDEIRWEEKSDSKYKIN